MAKRIDNILAVYSQASAAEIAAGMEWYRAAHVAADALHIAPRIGPAVVAALSPGLRWEANVAAARAMINGESLIGYGIRWYRNVAKAERIIAGEYPENVLGGNKVRAFYRCILNPENRTHVCIDGHAYGIWAGRRITLDSIPKIGDRLYAAISRDFILAARAVRILPLQMQAITWVTWRRIHAAEMKTWSVKKAA